MSTVGRVALGRRAVSAFGVGVALTVASGCTTSIDDPGTDPGTSPGGSPSTPSNPNTPSNPGNGVDPALDPDAIAEDCASFNGVVNAGLTKLRRLTREQFDNTVRDLLGSSGTPAAGISPDERIGPFHSNAIAPITELVVEQHQEAAKSVAMAAQARMTQIAPCDLSMDAGATCATRFVTEFGARAYRRPLESSEIQGYVSLFDVGRQGSTPQNGFRLVVEAMLQSPFFLYHADVGEAGTPQSAAVPLTPFELASRLSYFLWNSMPDAQLFDAAASGSLTGEGDVRAQVERMLADPKAAGTIALFHRQWLGLEELSGREKDARAFPSFNVELAEAMLQETARFTNHVVREGDGLLGTLLTSNMAFPEGALFQIYGATEPAGFNPGSPVMLDASRRAGILTQAAFLTRHAHRDQTSPVHRGIIIRENLLCQPIPSPPANVNNVPPPPSTATSTRERYAQHIADPSCSNCHLLMDPIGLGFENYDPIGAYRTSDGLGAVDATGAFHGTAPDLAGSFSGAIELVNKLAQSEEVADCVANQWFRFSLGRMESQNDACSVQSIREGFQASGGNVRALLTRIAISDAFRHVRSTGG